MEKRRRTSVRFFSPRRYIRFVQNVTRFSPLGLRGYLACLECRYGPFSWERTFLPSRTLMCVACRLIAPVIRGSFEENLARMQIPRNRGRVVPRDFGSMRFIASGISNDLETNRRQLIYAFLKLLDVHLHKKFNYKYDIPSVFRVVLIFFWQQFELKKYVRVSKNTKCERRLKSR